MAVTEREIVTLDLSPSEVRGIAASAKRAEIGGRSHVRSGGNGERERFLSEDQLVGQIGTYAGHRLLFGHVTMYRVSRYYADIYPTQGDGGSDVPGANIDFKASKVRDATRPKLAYRLPVRPHEKHDGIVCVLVLVECDSPDHLARAHFIGWATAADLPAEPEVDGVFRGAYIIPAQDLKPMMPVIWWGRV